VSTAALVAVGGVLVFAVVRLSTDRRYWQAGTPLVIVGASAALAGSTGMAVDFYLPVVLLNIGGGVILLASMLVGWPVVGVVVGALRGERHTWRRDRVRRRRYHLCTALLLAKNGIATAVLVPLYLAGLVTPLGIASTLLGAPAAGVCLYLCWRMLRTEPEPVRG
jgi:putative flippase GtrA